MYELRISVGIRETVGRITNFKRFYDNVHLVCPNRKRLFVQIYKCVVVCTGQNILAVQIYTSFAVCPRRNILAVKNIYVSCRLFRAESTCRTNINVGCYLSDADTCRTNTRIYFGCRSSEALYEYIV